MSDCYVSYVDELIVSSDLPKRQNIVDVLEKRSRKSSLCDGQNCSLVYYHKACILWQSTKDFTENSLNDIDSYFQLSIDANNKNGMAYGKYGLFLENTEIIRIKLGFQFSEEAVILNFNEAIKYCNNDDNSKQKFMESLKRFENRHNNNNNNNKNKENESKQMNNNNNNNNNDYYYSIANEKVNGIGDLEEDIFGEEEDNAADATNEANNEADNKAENKADDDSDADNEDENEPFEPVSMIEVTNNAMPISTSLSSQTQKNNNNNNKSDKKRSSMILLQSETKMEDDNGVTADILDDNNNNNNLSSRLSSVSDAAILEIRRLTQNHEHITRRRHSLNSNNCNNNNNNKNKIKNKNSKRRKSESKNRRKSLGIKTPMEITRSRSPTFTK